MTFALGASYSNQGTSATATTGTITAPSSGNLVVYGLVANGSGAVALASGGSTFTEIVNEVPSGETAVIALYWKIAGVSEPTAYTIDLTSSRAYGTFCYVFTSATDAEIDALANTHIQTGKETHINCGAYDSQVIADDAVAVVFGGKDTANAASPEAYTTADNSYTGVVGSSGDGRCLGAAYRIYTTGETASGDVRIDTADLSDSKNDFVFSAHVSFVESVGGGGGNSVSRLTLLGVN